MSLSLWESQVVLLPNGGARLKNMDNLPASSQKTLSDVCFVMGFASIVGSILIWNAAKKPDPAHGERFGIFVGLWAPTFFILSDRLSKKKSLL